jgi:hypothetical protein
MSVSVKYELNKTNEQNINIKELVIPSDVLSSIKELITEDRFNLFKIKSNDSIDRNLRKVENIISKLLQIKNEGLLKEKELEKKFLILKKSNVQMELELKKNLNI